MWSDNFERRAAEMRHRNNKQRSVSPHDHEYPRIPDGPANTVAVQRHYTVKELGELWNLSTTTITRLFRDEPGVLKIGNARPARGPRSHTTLRIPESIVQ